MKARLLYAFSLKEGIMLFIASRASLGIYMLEFALWGSSGLMKVCFFGTSWVSYYKVADSTILLPLMALTFLYPLLEFVTDSFFCLGTLVPVADGPPASSYIITVPFLLSTGLLTFIKSRFAEDLKFKFVLNSGFLNLRSSSRDF